MADFNPYVEWLGLSADVAEPNHYQLLGLPNFEADVAKIAVAADKAMSRVRGFRPGPNAKAWSKLLDELLLAKGRLLDADRKSEYDADLRELGVAAKTEASTEAPSKVTVTAPTSAGWDPRFPPGMGPNVGKSPPAKTEPAKTEPAKSEPVAPVPQPAPAPASPAPVAEAPLTPAPLAPASAAAPVATLPTTPPTAWPSSMLHPVAHGPAAAQPMAQPMTQPAPLAQPMYPQQPYGAPQVPGYQQPQVYPAAVQPYPQQPQYGQPAYGQPPYGAPGYPTAQVIGNQPAYPPQPTYPQYPAANYAAPPNEPPVSNYTFGQFQPPTAAGLGGYGATAHSPYAPGEATSGMPLDPMAPVAIPTAPASADDSKQARVVGFAAHQAATSAIPRGKAVSSAPAAASVSAATSAPAAALNAPANSAAASQSTPAMMAPTLSASSADSALAAAYSEKSKSDQTLFYVSGGAVVLLLGAIVFAVINANSGSPELAQNDGVQIPAEPKVNPPKPAEPAVIKPPPMKPKLETPSSEHPKPPIDKPKPTEPLPPMRDPFAEMPAETKPVEPKPIEPKPSEPKPMPPEMKPVEPKPVEPKPAEPKPPEPTTIPVPMPPKPADPPAEMKLSAADLAALSAAMNGAKESLRERNFEETDKHLATAKKLAKSADQLAKLNRLDVLTQYVKQFDRSLKTLMADENFDAGAELILGKSTRVVVVERSPTGIVIRINGQNKSYTLANMPDGLAMALIDQRLPTTDPVSKVIKGAYLAAAKIPTEENQAKAKELFAEAVQGGVSEVADLPLVLTDTYDFKE